MDKKEFGLHGEAIAVEYLKNIGHIIIEKNFRTKFGEIDIISRYKNRIYVSEVKTRKDITYGLPFENVNLKKVNKMITTYKAYCKNRNIFDCDCTFSIISIVIDNNGLVKIKYIEDIWE